MVCLIILSHKRIITFRLARRLIVGAIILTIIPASFYVRLPFAVGVTILMSIGMYWVFWASEKVEKQQGNKNNKTL